MFSLIVEKVLVIMFGWIGEWGMLYKALLVQEQNTKTLYKKQSVYHLCIWSIERFCENQFDICSNKKIESISCFLIHLLIDYM